jgi:hypothetical protein
MHEASSLIIVDCHKNNRSAEQLQERDHVGLILPGEVETESAESEVGRNAPRHPPVSSQNLSWQYDPSARRSRALES